jgi:transcriptional regulator with XRE-family HTH domain
MSDDRKPRGSDLAPDQKAKIEEIRLGARTPEARARHKAIREQFQDKPSLRDLVRQGKIDPDDITTMGAVGELHKALAAVRRIREAKGLKMTQVARLAEMSPAALSRLEGGKNQRPTFETLARYAAAVGLDVQIVLRDRGDLSRATDATGSAAMSVPVSLVAEMVAEIERSLAGIRHQFETSSGDRGELPVTATQTGPADPTVGATSGGGEEPATPSSEAAARPKRPLLLTRLGDDRPARLCTNIQYFTIVICDAE